MTSEEEKRLILLSAILRLGGAGTKNQVLDEINQAGFMQLSHSDLQIMKSRNELKWRNDLAYIRKHLVTEGILSDSAWNKWQITERGRSYFASLGSRISNQQHFRHINSGAIQNITELASRIELSDENALSGETSFVEGRQALQWTTRYERDSKLRAAAIKLHGTVCMGCGFDFEKKYGPIGAGFIEVHHTKPISSLGGSSPIDPARDLVVLCSNCHSVVHRKRQSPLSLDELRNTMK